MKYTVEVKEDVTYWYKEGTNILHRENGPAIEWAIGYDDGYYAWYINGQCHREDGPAVERNTGCKEYWIDGIHLTEEQFNNRNEKSFTTDELKNMSLEELHEIIS